jgi:hypothetical protein
VPDTADHTVGSTPPATARKVTFLPGPARLLPARPGPTAEARLLENLAVALDFCALEVFEESATLADQAQQSAAGVVVLDVGLEVIGQPVDPLREERDLHLGGSGVAVVTPVSIDQGLLPVGRHGHG